MEQNMQMPIQGAEEMGRATDNVIAHLSLGEVVIPRAFLDDPQVAQLLQQIFQAGGADINEFTVGHELNKINPETGYPEFFFKKLFRRFAPLALSFFAPGLGTAIGSSILGAGALGASTLGNALLGAGIGGLTGGGLKGALLGGLSGGIGANIGSLGAGGNLPWNQGSGILGSIGDATGLTSNSGLGSILGGLSGGSGGGSSFGVGNITSIIGGLNQDKELKKARDAQLAAQNQQLANINSLRNINIDDDQGYQFARRQGQEGLNASLGAQGNLFSGRALMAASDFNQDLANRYYNDAYQREAQRIGLANQSIGNIGDIRANSGLSRAENLSQALLGGLGGGLSQDELLRRLYGQGY